MLTCVLHLSETRPASVRGNLPGLYSADPDGGHIRRRTTKWPRPIAYCDKAIAAALTKLAEVKPITEAKGKRTG